MYSCTHKPLHTYHPVYSPKFSKIYRCWIVWGKNIHVVIIPSFLAIVSLGQSSYLHLISRSQLIASGFSYLDRGSWQIDIYTIPIFSDYWLGSHVGYNRSRRVHGRERPGDGLDRFPDPQGVL